MLGKPKELDRCNLAYSTTIGCIIGGCISFVVNSTLEEISISPFFSLTYGILFSVIGILMI